MKLAQITNDIGSSMSINIINPSFVSSGQLCAGALPLLTPMDSTDPLFLFFTKMYEEVNRDPNQEVATRLQISILRSIYQNKIKYFVCTKKSLTALSASDDMLKHKVQKIHKESYSKLGTEFGSMFVQQIRRMNGFIPSIWAISHSSSLSTWQQLPGSVLAQQLQSSLGPNPNLSHLSFTDEQINIMSTDEINLVIGALTGAQRVIALDKSMDFNDI